MKKLSCFVPHTGTEAPATPYDKNNLKLVIHFAKDRPRPDVAVMVVSVMSTNTIPVKNFTFQAAVPKVSWSSLGLAMKIIMI